MKEELLVESPYFVLPAGAQATVKALHERNVRVRVLTNSLASNDMLPAHSGYAKTRRRLLENGMELYELRPGVVPANSYRVLLDPNGAIVWETVRDGNRVRYRDEPETRFRRRFVAGLWKLLPIDSQL